MRANCRQSAINPCAQTMRNHRAEHASQPRHCLWTPRPAWAITCHSSKRGVLATRKPMLLLRLSGSLLLRFDERQLLELLFQLPPRSTRSKSLSKQSHAHFSASSRCGFECHHAICETPLKKLEALPAARPTPARARTVSTTAWLEACIAWPIHAATRVRNWSALM